MSRKLTRWLRIAGRDPALVPRIVLRKVRCGPGLGAGAPRRRRLGSVLFEFDPALGEMARAMYCGLYEIRVIDALRRLLGPGGVFVDVGAHIGYHSAIAADIVGTTGAVYSFEPVRVHFERLERMARMNPAHDIVPVRAAAADRNGDATISIAGSSNAGWNTLVPGHMPPAREERTERVRLIRLDEFLQERGVRTVTLIKIDVEGFELPVLNGLRSFLATTPEPPPIVCEIAPRAYPLLATSLADLEGAMTAVGYRSFSLRWPRRPLDLTGLRTIEDVLFLPVGRRGVRPRASSGTGQRES